MRNLEKQKEWARTHSERIKAMRRKRYREDPAYRAKFRVQARASKKKALANPTSWLGYALYVSRGRAKTEGLEHTITKYDIITPTHCPVLGVEFVFGQQRHPHGPSLDRVDNSKGYIAGNVRVISSRANRLKSDASLKELHAIVSYMEATLGTPC